MNATELELQNDMLEKDLEFIRGELGPKFKKVDPRDKDKKIKMLETKLMAVKREISTFKFTIESSNQRVATEFGPKLDQFNLQFKEVEGQLLMVKQEARNRDFQNDVGLEDNQRTKQTPINELTLQQAQVRGDDRFARAFEDLNVAHKNVTDAQTLARDVNTELQRMKEQLKKAAETAKDTQSLTKRSKELINYFYRQLQTDKIIWCCLITVVLLILIVIIMSLAGVKSSSFNSKVLPNQN